MEGKMASRATCVSHRTSPVLDHDRPGARNSGVEVGTWFTGPARLTNTMFDGWGFRRIGTRTAPQQLPLWLLPEAWHSMA